MDQNYLNVKINLFKKNVSGCGWFIVATRPHQDLVDFRDFTGG